MAFLKRLGYFLLGLSVGLVFLAIFLRKKTEETGVQFCYLPNCRVLKELRSKPLVFSEDAQAMMEAGRLDSAAITQLLNEGDVDFGNSETRAQPCKIYFINARYKQQDYRAELHNCEEQVVLEQLQVP